MKEAFALLLMSGIFGVVGFCIAKGPQQMPDDEERAWLSALGVPPDDDHDDETSAG